MLPLARVNYDVKHTVRRLIHSLGLEENISGGKASSSSGLAWPTVRRSDVHRTVSPLFMSSGIVALPGLPEQGVGCMLRRDLTTESEDLVARERRRLNERV
jgi:hypothetical protein